MSSAVINLSFKCDRKRPCGRCTQLGLVCRPEYPCRGLLGLSLLTQTGLCVYEVDDPSQRSSAQDDHSRLRHRVAELEGVIREVGSALSIRRTHVFIQPQMKNKPHPRWTKSGSSPGEQFEKCHARARSRSTSEESAVESRHQSDLSHPSTDSNAVPNETSAENQMPCLTNETLQPNYSPSLFSPRPTGTSVPLSALSYSPHFDIHSPSSAPSTGIVTPTEEHSQMQIAIAGDQDLGLTNDIDLASLFMSYPNLMGCDEGPGHVDRMFGANTHSQYVDPRSTKYHHAQFLDGHCGCLNEAASYSVVLELSLRLRKAADILSHSANHHFNNGCPLNRRILDLDAFAT